MLDGTLRGANQSSYRLCTLCQRSLPPLEEFVRVRSEEFDSPEFLFSGVRFLLRLCSEKYFTSVSSQHQVPTSSDARLNFGGQNSREADASLTPKSTIDATSSRPHESPIPFGLTRACSMPLVFS